MNKANIKFVIANRPLSDGKYPIYLRIIKNRKKKEINLGLKCRKEDFLNDSLTRNHPDFQIENEILSNLKSRGLKIIREFQIEGVDFSLEEFEQKFRGNKSRNINLFQFFDEIIEEMKLSGRIGNSNAYLEAKISLMRFAGRKLSFKDVTPAFLEKFEVYLRSRGNEAGGIAFKMREIRAIFNKAIDRNIIPQEYYPFKVYKISKLKGKSNKRALSISEFKAIKNIDLSHHPHLIEAYHYFMFSFYTRGMNFVDIMKLKRSNIKNNRIEYTRSKTKGQFNIEITPIVKNIMEYYQDKNPNTDYVFPIILRHNLTPKQLSDRKHKVLSRYNKKLKELGELAGIETTLTSYVARHSFATILKQIGTSTDIISELMGHSDVQITMTYLKEFDTEILDKENRKLLEL